MGIRIHKKIGYALTDVKYDKKRWDITDSRFNLKSWNRESVEEWHDKEKMDDFIKYLEIVHKKNENIEISISFELYALKTWDEETKKKKTCVE